MNPLQSSLVHKIHEPKKKSAAPAPALILLHGRGANEDDLLGLAEYLDERLFIISARAPFAFQMGSGYTWYDLEEVGRPDPTMFAESFQKLTQFFLDVKKGYPVNPAKIFFCGFSMGTVMSYAMALTRPDEVAGVLANSGYIPESADITLAWDKIRGKPYFIAHGRYDPVIPMVFAERARDLLEKAGAQLAYHEYDMAHQITEQSLNDMMGWLTRQIEGS